MSRSLQADTGCTFQRRWVMHDGLGPRLGRIRPHQHIPLDVAAGAIVSTRATLADLVELAVRPAACSPALLILGEVATWPSGYTGSAKRR